MKIKTALKAAAVAATLIFAGASQAADIGYDPVEMGLAQTTTGGKVLNGSDGAQFLEVYQLSHTTLADAILAFCIQPNVAQGEGTVYTQHAGVMGLSSIIHDDVGDSHLANRAARVQALFEQNYGSLSSGQTAQDNSVARLEFQLALWDLVADDGTLASSAGKQYFTPGTVAYSMSYDDPVYLDLTHVQTMLNKTINANLTNAYQYTLFSGKIGNGDVDNSQALLSVSAVPEADTWAMMAVGLGLVGFMGRRKSKQSEKFAV